METPRRAMAAFGGNADDLAARELAGLRLYCRSLIRDEMAAEDIVQEAFARVTPRLGRLRGNPAAYLLIVVRNLCVDEMRRRAAESEASSRQEARPGARSAEDCAIDRVTLGAVWQGLSADDRRILAAHLAGLSLAELSKAFGVSPQAAGQRVSRARRRARVLAATHAPPESHADL